MGKRSRPSRRKKPDRRPERPGAQPAAGQAPSPHRGRWRLAAAMALAGVAVALAAWQVWMVSGRMRAGDVSDRWRPDELPPGAREERLSHPFMPPLDEAGVPLAVPSKDPAVATLIQEAAAVARRILEQYPSDAAAVATAARLHRQLGDADRAVSAWERCLELDPKCVPAYVGIGSVCVERGQYAKAEAVMRRAQAIAPDSPQVAVLLATALMNQGKLRETVALLEARTQDANAPMPCFLLLGQAHLQLKDYARAKPCFEAAARMAPDFANAHYGLATTCARLGQHEEAQEHMKRFQEAERSRLARQIEDGKRRDDEAAVRRLAADAHIAAAAIFSAHGNAPEAERHRREADRLRLTRSERSDGRARVARPEQSDGRGVAGDNAGRAADASARPSLPKTTSPSAESPAAGIELRDATAETGIAFQHTDGGSGRYYIMETVCAGLATFDYDGDGRIDIYFVNGAPLAGAAPARPPRHALYRNLGGWRFQDVTEQAGVACTAYGLGVTAGDYDNDGRPDIYLSNFGPNVLYRNNGDGAFTDATRQAGVAGLGKVGAGACFLDADGDANLDLYVANYLDFSYDKHVAVTERGVPAYASPSRYRPLPGILYRNEGNGRFADASAPSEIGQHASWGMGTVCGDYDNDGRTDIFVANDVSANFLFHNQGQGRFEEVGTVAGAAYDVYGTPQGSMGVDCGDFDNDGRLDFYQTCYQLQHVVLYRNLGDGLFEDVSLVTGAAAGSYGNVKWGCGIVDFDNDGRRDLFVGCGHLQDRVEEYDRTTTYRTHNVLLWNAGHRRTAFPGGRESAGRDGLERPSYASPQFVDISEQCGLRAVPVRSARGAAFDDLDNDGDLDVVVLNSREPPTVLRNMLIENGCTNHWLQVRLQGVKTNRDGVGAQVRVTVGDLTLLDEVHSGRGYQSHWGSRLHFGLGKRDRVDRIEVRWIGGGVDVLENIAVDRLVTISEGAGNTLAAGK